MRVFVTGGTGHAGSYIIPELVAAGHGVTGLARSDTSAAALSALGATVRRGDLEDLDGLKEAAAGGRRGALNHARVRRGTRGNRKAAGRGGQHRLGREPGPTSHRGRPGPSQQR